MTEPAPHPFAPPPPPERAQPLEGLALEPLQRRFGAVPVLGAYALVNGLISIAVMTAAALVTGVPLVFPSLGPTAYLLFSDPLGAAAAPRNTILGHVIGVLAGWGSLAVFGLQDVGAADAMGATPGRIGAAAVSLAVTSGLMVWLRLPHPPAAATTLIVSLGILPRVDELVVLVLAVILLAAQGWIINRLAGVPVPLWSPRREPLVVRPGGMSG
ncbi:HPP family protein [Euzebya pacifica]|uniref:HPP family protein n=1 Tax=Euzebya pacifica TaxID=1608957 RepID=UPI0030FBD3BA